MNSWLNVHALLQVLGYGVVLGAGLPALFALGVRAQALGTGTAHLDESGVSAEPRRPVLLGLAYVVYALVVAAIVVGVLFVARDFIGHHTGWYILGAVKP